MRSGGRWGARVRSVHGVIVSGDASPSVLAAVKQYVESCRYTPATRASKQVGARVQE